MRVAVYGAESERRDFAEAIPALPGCCYRSIQVIGYSDYDSYIDGLRDSPPGCVIVTADGAAGMEGVIAARSLLGDVPIIWFSDDGNFGAQSYRLGCTYFHVKPVSSEILSSAMAKCV